MYHLLQHEETLLFAHSVREPMRFLYSFGNKKWLFHYKAFADVVTAVDTKSVLCEVGVHALCLSVTEISVSVIA